MNAAVPPPSTSPSPTSPSSTPSPTTPSLTNMAAPGPATDLQDAILAGNPFILLPFDQVQPGPPAAAVFDATAAALATRGVVVVRIANPLAAPLSVGRIMLQIATTDETHDDGAARVMIALAKKATGASHLVIAVNDADTLAPTALSFLQLLAASHAGSAAYPPPQIVFAGSTAFQALLADQRFQTIRDALDAPRPAPPAPPSPELPAPELPAPELPAPELSASTLSTPAPPASAATTLTTAALVTAVTVPPPPRARAPIRALQAIGALSVAFVLFFLLLFTVGSTFIHRPATAPRQGPAPTSAPAAPPSAPQTQPPTPATAPPATTAPTREPDPPQPLPTSTEPTTTSQPEPPRAIPQALEDPVTERTRLRREFDAFLASRSPASPPHPPPERDRLFREYLTRRQSPANNPANNPAPNPTGASPAPSATSTILIRYLATSPQAEAAARRIATTLQGQASGTDLQPVPTVPPVATIRYFFHPDRRAALAIAAATPVPGGEWHIEDATSTPTRPGPGTLEILLPAPPPQ